jgi:hypothetical protein
METHTEREREERERISDIKNEERMCEKQNGKMGESEK